MGKILPTQNSKNIGDLYTGFVRNSKMNKSNANIIQFISVLLSENLTPQKPINKWAWVKKKKH
jgi:hypothetical protein